MNIFFNEYSGFCFELNFELNHFLARFNENMNFQNVLPRATLRSVFNQDCEAEDWKRFEINSFCYLKAVFSAEPPVDSDFLYVTK